MPENQDGQTDNKDLIQPDRDSDHEDETYESHPHLVVPPRYLQPESRHSYSVAIKSHRGNLPPTEYMREINEIIPDGAERIMLMAEKNSEHRRWMERTGLEASITQAKGNLARSNWGLGIGAGIAISFLVAAATLISQGHEISGTVIGSVDIVGLVSVFVIGRLVPNKSTDSRPDRVEHALEKQDGTQKIKGE